MSTQNTRIKISNGLKPKMAMDEGGEEEAVAGHGDEYVAVFLGHTLTPPLVEATIMVSVFQTKVQTNKTKSIRYMKVRVLLSTLS